MDHMCVLLVDLQSDLSECYGMHELDFLDPVNELVYSRSEGMNCCLRQVIAHKF